MTPADRHRPPRCANCKRPYIPNRRSNGFQRYCARRECQNSRAQLNKNRKSPYYVRDGVYICDTCHEQRPTDEFPLSKAGNRKPKCKICTAQKRKKEPRKGFVMDRKVEGYYPLPEWIGPLRKDLTAQEREVADNAICFRCIHLRQCQDIVRKSARLQRVINTQCGF